MAFKKTIDNREFIFEYLFDKNKNITAYLITTKVGKGAINFEMEIGNNGNWKFISKNLPQEIKSLKNELANAIEEATY